MKRINGMFSERLLKWVFPGLIIGLGIVQSCKVDPPEPTPQYDPTPMVIEKPLGLPPFDDNKNNPITVEGVKLGRMLFFDPILSGDSTQSCGSCHLPERAFTDELAFSVGIDGLEGGRGAPPAFNMAYNPEFGLNATHHFGGFFWDGRANTLEDQALQPIENPIEMHALLPNVIARLNRHPDYPAVFFDAFGKDVIDEQQLSKAIAQFERSIISGNSPFDMMNKGEIPWDDDVLDGLILFNDFYGGDCFHCHGENAGLFTDYTYRNNGLDAVFHYDDFDDPGLGMVTGDTADYGRFKVPTLRNVAVTPPYMHDGRFETLEEVLDFYSEGVQQTPFTDPLMEFQSTGGADLTADEKQKIIAFLNALTDTAFLHNEAYTSPF